MINIERMENFERYWAQRYGGTPEAAARHRFVSREGYGLPGMASHYRTYCDTLDSLSAANQRVVPVEPIIAAPHPLEITMGPGARSGSVQGLQA